MHDVIIIVLLVLIFKNLHTFRLRSKVSHAIHLYALDCIRDKRLRIVYYEDIYPYSFTLLNIFNWTYTSVIPKNKLKIIESYM